MSGDKSRSEAADMQFFRAASVLTRRDKIQNDVRNKLQAENFIKPVNKYKGNRKDTYSP